MTGNEVKGREGKKNTEEMVETKLKNKTQIRIKIAKREIR